jgi:DNA-binding NarL/FixJ family response regulator
VTATRILLADDHTLVRAGIRALLNELPDAEVVAEASDGREALALVAQHLPDIVLMDISMPGISGLEAARQIRRDFPGVRVIILSMHSNEEHVLQALQAGATGYMLKASATQELQLAVHAAMSGELYLSPRVSRHVVQGYIQRVDPEAGSLDLLTPRQRMVLRLIAEGRTNKQIAHLLVLSVKTVEAHRAQLMQRLGIRDVPGLTRFAMRMGMVSPDR